MSTKSLVFQSLLAEDICAFIAHKRALNRRYRTEERALHLFDRYLVECEIHEACAITPKVIEAFLASRPRCQPRSYNHLLGVVNRLFDWMVAQESIPASPVRTRARRTTAQGSPFLFDGGQIQQLLEAAAALPDYARAPLRGKSYVMIFTLLYGLGLRVGEVSRLRCKDVDLGRQLLVIRETKFSKSRLVPFGPKMGKRIEEYVNHCTQRRGPLSQESPVFSFAQGRPIHRNTITQTFHTLVLQLRLEVPPGVRPPCAHSLRHSFAVSTLLRWYRAGIDPGKRLIHLATFLGHVDPTSTAVYLTITADLLREASHRFERFASPELGRV